MPTGYTSKLYEGEDQTFEDFAWSCARAFGALILMRDDPADAPIPEKFEPSSYHVEKLAEAERELAEFEAMGTAEQADLYLAECAENVAKRAEEVRKRRDLRERYEAMLWQVETWEPPTADHEGMKTFMVEQLKSSIDFDCHPGTDVYPARLPDRIEDWYDDRIKKLRWNVDYHRKSLAEEIERTNERNGWVSALRDSLDGSRV
jgi:hypothetical protein